MRQKKYLFLVLILVFLLAITNVKAEECIDLGIAKTEYLPKETVQIEVNADLIRDILLNDVGFYRASSRLPVNFFISKITETKYFIWFDLPSEPGNYFFRMKGVCQDGKWHTITLPVKIKKTKASLYENLRPKVEDNWLSLTLEEHILSAAAMSHIFYDEALIAYLGRSDSCFGGGCNTKHNSLTLISFKDSLIRQKMQDYIEASQNYVKGEWNLEIISGESQQCSITKNDGTIQINLSSGLNTINLDLSNMTNDQINIVINCEKEVDGKLIFNYKYLTKEFESQGTGTYLLFNLENSGCWGSGLRNGCEMESTLYALLSLAMTNKLDKNNTAHNAAIYWLNQNTLTVEEKIVNYYLTKEAEILTQILDSQSSSGWWPKNIENYGPDIKTTSLAILALKNSPSYNYSTSEALQKAEEWLLNKEILTLSEEAFILTFAFQNKNIEPLLAFWPGIIKVKSQGTFDLILLNRGTTNIIIDTELLNTTSSVNLSIDSIKNVQFNLPRITTIDGRTIFENLYLNYKSKNSQENYDYYIPVLIFTEKSSSEGRQGGMGSSEKEINESKQKEIINDTTQEWENKTTELNDSLIKQRFRFIEKKINTTADLAEGRFTITIRLENRLDKDLEDISITYSSTLIGLVEKIEPSFIGKLERGEKETITIHLLPTTAKIYEGEIIANAKYGSEKITTNLPLTLDISGIPSTEEKTCAEMGGKKCEEENEFCDENEGIITSAKDTYYCCIPDTACKKKSAKGRIIGLVIVFIIIILLILLVIILRRKPRREMQEFLKEATEGYEKRFQRPPSIRR